jgi:hypothetical protein
VGIARLVRNSRLRSVASGLPAWKRDQIGPQARHRLYRASAQEHFLLNERDERVRVEV